MRRMRCFVPLAGAIVLVACAAGQAMAQFVVFGDRDVFKATILPQINDIFDTIPSGRVIPNGSALGGIIYTLNDSSADLFITTGGAKVNEPNGFDKFFNGAESPLLPADVVTFTFSTPITAFGVSFNAFGNAPGTFLLTTNLGDLAPSSFNPFPGFPTGHFAGFTTDRPVTSVTVLEAPGNNLAFGLDDLVVQSVPEPSSLMLLCVGILGIVAYARCAAAGGIGGQVTCGTRGNTG